MIVRSDLPLGMLAAQVTHAAGESSPGKLPPGTHAVVLAVPAEEALVRERDRLSRLGVAHVAVFECDAPYEGQMMAVGLRPARKEVVRRALSALPLLR